jgi:soluble lytic murein transglycosylase
MDAEVWIENVPYNETRGYVQRVLWHSLVFAWRDSGQPQPVDGWLAPVQPVAAPAAADVGRKP